MPVTATARTRPLNLERTTDRNATCVPVTDCAPPAMARESEGEPDMNRTTNGRARQTAGVGRLVRRLERERRKWSWGSAELVATEQAWRAGGAEALGRGG